MAAEQNLERRIEIRLNRSEVISYLSSTHRTPSIEEPEEAVTIKSELRNEAELMSDIDIVKTESPYNREQEIAKGPVKGFNCPTCHLNFKYRHHLNHHQSTNQKCSVQTNQSGDVKLDKTYFLHQCPTCNKCFETKYFLRRHMVVHSGKKRFQCSICGESLSTRSSLSKHVKIHDRDAATLEGQGQRTHSCPKCKKEFRRYISLRLHMSLHRETPYFPYICPTCLERYKNKDNFNRHKRKKHLFKCEYCELVFPYKIKLDGHVYTYHRGINVENKDKDELGTNVSPRTFSCPQCKAIFIRRDGLRSHMKVHTEEKPYRCSKCPKMFKWRSTLRAHTQKEHCVTNVKYSCPECKKELKTSCSLRRHMTIHSEKPRKPYICPMCHEGFKLEAKFKCHKQKEHIFKCEHCELAFPHKQNLDAHVCTYQRGINIDDKAELGTNVSQRSRSCPHCEAVFARADSLRSHMKVHSEERPYRCGKCTKTFKWRSTLYNHTRQEHFVKFNNSNSTISKQKHSKSKSKSSDFTSSCSVKHSCPECKKEFRASYNLRRHMTIHSEKPHKPYFCTTCHGRFKNQDNFKCHTQKKHLFKCEHCKLAFTHNQNLDAHMSKCHRGRILNKADGISNEGIKKGMALSGKGFFCPVCKKVFEKFVHLQDHIVVHSNENQYVCTKCLLDFNTEQDLDCHTQKEHMFQCEHCELSFLNKSGLEVHILNCHTDKITKSYQVMPNKDDKNGTSVGQLMYACPVCKKTFATADRLRGHKAAHSDERSYVCPICSKAFKWNCNLQKHTRKKHSNLEVKNRMTSIEEASDPFAVVLTIKEEQRTEDDFPIILKTASLQDASDPEVGVQRKGFQCPTCSLTFKYHLHLKHHLTTSSGCTIQHNPNNDVKLF